MEERENLGAPKREEMKDTGGQNGTIDPEIGEPSLTATFAVLHYKHFHESVLVAQLNCVDCCKYYAIYKNHGNFYLACMTLVLTLVFSVAALATSIVALKQ